MISCPVCGKYTFRAEGDYDICPVCGWENDDIQIDYPDETGANELSLNDYRKQYAATQKNN